MSQVSLHPYDPGQASSLDRFAEMYPLHPYRHVASLGAHQQRDLFKLRLQTLVAAGPGAVWTAVAAGEVVGLVRIQRLGWDTELLEINAGRLDAVVWDSSVPGRLRAWAALLEQAMEWGQAGRLQHITCRLDAADITGAQSLESAGFRLMDGIVTLGRAPAESAAAGKADVEIRSGRADDAADAGSLAQQAFRVDRFHNDPAIPPHRADALYARWAENSLLRNAADHTVVAHDSEGMLGFVTCQLRAETAAVLGGPLGVIPLVAVAGRARGRGVGYRMTTAALGWFRTQGCPLVEVGTQMANVAALRLYQACGFSVISSSLSFRTVGTDGIILRTKGTS